MAEPAPVLSLGSLNADFQVRVERRPEISETLLARDFVRLGGGKAANVAWFARQLGHPAVLLARVGDDDLAEQALAPLRHAGVELGAVGRAAGRATGVAMISVPPDGKKGIVLAANANREWDGAACETALAAVRAAPEGAVLVVDCEIPVDLAERAAETAAARGLPVVLDPSPADRVSDRLLARTRVALPNPSEAEGLTGIAVEDAGSAGKAGRALLRRGAAAACVKLPDGGCVVAEGEHRSRIGNLPVEVVDTTGAGDAFAGALAVALAEGRDLVQAAVRGCAAAHLAVGGFGSQPSYPDRRALEEMAARLPVYGHGR